MTTLEIISLIAIFFGPFSAVFASQYLQNKKIKKEEKMRLFLDLLTDRHLKNMSSTWVQRLNVVPFVFRKNKEIRRYFEHYLSVVNTNDDNQINPVLYDLLYEMSQEVGLTSLKPTDFGRYYYPDSLHERVLGEHTLYRNVYLDELKKFTDEKRAKGFEKLKNELSNSENPMPNNSTEPAS